VVGSNFYSAFYDAWTEPDDASLYTVYVREEPTPQFGARVIVEVGDTPIFQTFLRPNARRTEKAGQQAAQRARLYVRKYHEPREVY
jgi:Curli assembly protein CsgE.